MDHLTVVLHDVRALARVVGALSARALPVRHLHTDGNRLCVLVGGRAGRAHPVLERLVDVEVRPDGRCLAPTTLSAVRREPSPRSTTPHRWVRAGAVVEQ